MNHEQFAGNAQPAPTGPLSTIPGMTYVSPLPPTRPVSKLPLALGLVALVFAVVAGTALVMRLTAQTGLTNADILLSAVENNLGTTSFRQDMSYANGSYTLLADVSAITNPRLSGYKVTTISGRASQVSSYADNRNSYLKYVKADPGLIPVNAINQWVSFQQNGVSPTAAPEHLRQLTEPAYQLLRPFMIGQFSENQRQELVKQWTTNPVLTFDDKAVKAASVEGKDVLVYAVTFNTANLKAYARVAAGYQGVSDIALNRALADLELYSTNTLYVDPIAKRIIKIEFGSSTGTVTTIFSGFNTTPVANEPKPTYQYSELSPAPRI